MKKTVSEEKTICDFCHKEPSRHKCLGCGKDVCLDCEKTEGTEYDHAIFFSGSDDGFYCHTCDRTDKSPLHSAYQAIRTLRHELDGFNENFRKRSDKAEALVKKLLAARETNQ